MDLIEIARKNTEAWNRHDVQAIVATYAGPATYSNPRAGDNLNPEATGKFHSAVWKAYPDAKVEIINIGDIGGGLVVSEWIMHGTNTGVLPDGTPATRRTVALHGASFAQFEGDKVRSERVYYDRQNLFEQLGLTEAKGAALIAGEGAFRSRPDS
ncbi:MAG: ester cyclase [Verrucomicrobia bacterium]|nr:ester cyclase [Verrucomicrobiota bacterium]